jgi:hypothetical protein
MGMARKVDGVWLVRDEFVVSRYDFEGTADEVKACIDLAVDKARAMGMVDEGRFDLTTQRGYYSDDYEIVMTYYFERTETDKEKASREKIEAKMKADAAAKRKKAAEKRKLKKDAEFAEYERLKEKFEGVEE